MVSPRKQKALDKIKDLNLDKQRQVFIPPFLPVTGAMDVDSLPVCESLPEFVLPDWDISDQQEQDGEQPFITEEAIRDGPLNKLLQKMVASEAHLLANCPHKFLPDCIRSPPQTPAPSFVQHQEDLQNKQLDNVWNLSFQNNQTKEPSDHAKYMTSMQDFRQNQEPLSQLQDLSPVQKDADLNTSDLDMVEDDLSHLNSFIKDIQSLSKEFNLEDAQREPHSASLQDIPISTGQGKQLQLEQPSSSSDLLPNGAKDVGDSHQDIYDDKDVDLQSPTLYTPLVSSAMQQQTLDHSAPPQSIPGLSTAQSVPPGLSDFQQETPGLLISKDEGQLATEEVANTGEKGSSEILDIVSGDLRYQEACIGINQPPLPRRQALEERLSARSMQSLLRVISQDEITCRNNPSKSSSFDPEFAITFYQYRMHTGQPWSSNQLRKLEKSALNMPQSCLTASEHKYLLQYENHTPPKEQKTYHEQLVIKLQAEQQRFYFFNYSKYAHKQNTYYRFSKQVRELWQQLRDTSISSTVETYPQYYGYVQQFKLPYDEMEQKFMESQTDIKFEFKGSVLQDGKLGVWNDNFKQGEIDLTKLPQKAQRKVVRNDANIHSLISQHMPDIVVQQQALVTFMGSPAPYYSSEWMFPVKVINVNGKKVAMLDKPVLKSYISRREVYQKVFKKLLQNYSIEQEGRAFSYDLWTLEEMKMLVRTSSYVKSNTTNRPILLRTKMEYLLEFSFLEDYTVEELIRWWTAITLQPYSALKVARVDVRNNTVVMIEDKFDAQRLYELVQQRLEVRTMLYCFKEMMAWVQQLPEGDYLLGHPNTSGKVWCYQAVHNITNEDEVLLMDLNTVKEPSSKKVYDFHSMCKSSNQISSKSIYVPPLWQPYFHNVPQLPHTFPPKVSGNVERTKVIQNPKARKRALEEQQGSLTLPRGNIDYGEV